MWGRKHRGTEAGGGRCVHDTRLLNDRASRTSLRSDVVSERDLGLGTALGHAPPPRHRDESHATPAVGGPLRPALHRNTIFGVGSPLTFPFTTPTMSVKDPRSNALIYRPESQWWDPDLVRSLCPKGTRGSRRCRK